MVFKDILELKKFVGGSVNPSMDIDAINPHILLTANRHLSPFLGEEFLEDITDKFSANDQDPKFLKILEHIQRPLSLLSVYEYAKVGNVQFGESGIMRVENTEYKTAYKYQENQFKQVHLFGGYDMLEKLLKFLVKNKDNYPLWKSSEESETMTNSLMNYSSDFRRAYGNHINRHTFEILRPIISDLEAVAIAPCIGEPLIELLKGESLTPKQKELLAIIRKALATFSIEEGQKRLWVRIQNGQVVQSETLGDQGYQKANVPGNMPMTYSDRHHDQWGNIHMNRIKKYLEKNIEEIDFKTYKTHTESEAIEAETENNEAETIDYTNKKILRF